MSLNLRRVVSSAFVVIIIVLTILISVVIGNQATNRIEVSIGDSLSEVAFQMAKKLDHFMWSRSGELEVLSKLSAFQEPIDSNEISSLLNQLKTSLPVFAEVEYLDAHGNEISSTDKLQSNKTGENQQVTDISVPVYGKQGQVIGVLAAQLNLDSVYELPKSILDPHNSRVQGVEVFLVSQKDEMIVLGSSNLVDLSMSSDELKQVSAAKNSWAVVSDVHNHSYLTSYAYSDGYLNYPGSELAVIVRQPTEVAFASVHELQGFIVRVGLVMAILFAMVGWFLVRWIVRPLGNSSKTVDLLRKVVNVHELGYLSDLELRDVLTGLPNRAALDDFLNQAVTEAIQQRTTLSFLYLDLDGFKEVNDALGNATGDKLLQEVALRLMGCTRENEIVARFGGDEFIVVLKTSVNKPMKEAEVVALRIINRINQSFCIGGKTLHVGCSVGAAVWYPEGPDSSETLRLAYEALYISKRNGKNQITFETAS